MIRCDKIHFRYDTNRFLYILSILKSKEDIYYIKAERIEDGGWELIIIYEDHDEPDYDEVEK